MLGFWRSWIFVVNWAPVLGSLTCCINEERKNLRWWDSEIRFAAFFFVHTKVCWKKVLTSRFSKVELFRVSRFWKKIWFIFSTFSMWILPKEIIGSSAWVMLNICVYMRVVFLKNTNMENTGKYHFVLATCFAGFRGLKLMEMKEQLQPRLSSNWKVDGVTSLVLYFRTHFPFQHVSATLAPFPSTKQKQQKSSFFRKCRRLFWGVDHFDWYQLLEVELIDI